MSIKVMTRVWSESSQKLGSLLVLLAIADFADDDGIAYPKIPTLAKKSRLSDRQVQKIIASLIESGELSVTHRPNQSSLYAVMTGGDSSPGGGNNSPLGVNSSSPGGELFYTPYKEGTVTEPSKEKEPRKRGQPIDSRSHHPAIQAVQSITGRFPKKLLWDEIIEKIGDEPDIPRMRLCLTEWVKKGWNPYNQAWLFDWYLNGGPPSNGNTSQRSRTFSGLP